MRSGDNMMRNLIIGVVLLGIVFFVAVNSGMVADQAVEWVKDHPKDPDAPDILYKTARWCDVTGNEDKAQALYWMLYQQYPERGDLCAPAMYYTAYDKVNGTYIVGIKKQAQTYLDILFNEYSGQTDWCSKAKELQDEVNYAH